MTTPQPAPTTSPRDGAQDGLAGYLEAMDADDAPAARPPRALLACSTASVTPDDLQRWFAELGLDPAFAPPPIRAVDAFEKVTGPSGIRTTYPLGETGPPRRRRPRTGRAATPR